MMRHIGVHDYDEIALGIGHTVDIGRTETELFLSLFDHYALLAVDLLQVLGHVVGAVRAVVVHDHDLEVVLCDGHVLHDEPDNYRKVVFFIVGRQNYGIDIWFDFELHEDGYDGIQSVCRFYYFN